MALRGLVVFRWPARFCFLLIHYVLRHRSDLIAIWSEIVRHTALRVVWLATCCIIFIVIDIIQVLRTKMHLHLVAHS